VTIDVWGENRAKGSRTKSGLGIERVGIPSIAGVMIRRRDSFCRPVVYIKNHLKVLNQGKKTKTFWFSPFSLPYPARYPALGHPPTANSAPSHSCCHLILYAVTSPPHYTGFTRRPTQTTRLLTPRYDRSRGGTTGKPGDCFTHQLVAYRQGWKGTHARSQRKHPMLRRYTCSRTGP
jgi:hypothetical protein